MNDIKYLGVQGLEELIILAQNGLAKKADTLQFDVMPDPIKYIGKVVQYIGVSDVTFTRSHFYYSNGVKWTEENISGCQATQIEMVTVLPAWVDADPQILYILKDTADKKMGLYVKNPSVNDSWFTVESSGSFSIVDTLPQWGDADSSTIYFKADGNILTCYIKKTDTIGAWYTLGGASQGTVDTALSATSTNPVQNKAIYAAIQDVLAQVANVYHYKGSCLAADLPVADNNVGDTWNLEDASSYGPSGTNVAWDGTKWDALGGDLTPDAVPTDGSQHSVMSGGVYDALLTKEAIANKTTVVDASSTDDQYPSAKAMYDALLAKENVNNKVSTVDASSTDDQYPSAKAMYDALLTKENVNNKVSTVDASSTDDQYPSAKAVHDALLTKENVDNKVTTVDVTATDTQYPSAKAVYDALKDLEPIPPGFVQNVDTGMQPVEDGKVMRISKTAFDALAQRDQNVMYYLDEEHDLIDAKPTCRDTAGNLVKGQKIVELTKAQYDALTDKDPDTYYMINDDLGKDYSMLGAVQGFLITPTDKHWIFADGSPVDANLHPRLAAVMPTLPDLRECALVGAGKNTTHSIAAHDEYTVGEFKDDQFQGHEHVQTTFNKNKNYDGTEKNNSNTVSGFTPTNGVCPDTANGTPRTGTTTHGKQVGVLFYIWAD